MRGVGSDWAKAGAARAQATAMANNTTSRVVARRATSWCSKKSTGCARQRAREGIENSIPIARKTDLVTQRADDVLRLQRWTPQVAADARPAVGPSQLELLQALKRRGPTTIADLEAALARLLGERLLAGFEGWLTAYTV